MNAPGPVFIAGLERSGTSLIFSLLASHPRLAMTRRTNLWRYFYGRYGDLADTVALDHCLSVMRRYKRLTVLGTDFEKLRVDFLAGGERTYARLFELIEQQYAAKLDKPRWGDKSLGTERHAAEILSAYPDARILHMVRDPRDRFASSATRWQRRGGVGAGTAEWLRSVHLARRLSERHPEQYRVITYETLARQPETCLQAVCAFLGEEYTPEMLSMSGAPGFREQGGNSSYEPRRPGEISTDSIGRFRDVLTEAQVSFVEWMAGREMQELGYERTRPRLALPSKLQFTFGSMPVEYVRARAWQTRDRLVRRRGEPLPAYRLIDAEDSEARTSRTW